ncbi:MAG: pyruvate kinase [Sulfurovum sp. AS07-7]|nr:MAG: pyruvate kinase [Sulfurovum sp. AS07-7]
MQKKTKVVITIGPATSTTKKIKELIELGVDVFRINFSHGDYTEHTQIIKKIRQISTQLDKTVAILQDISGPKVRIGKIEGVLELKMGDTIWLSKIPSLNRLTLNLSYPQIIDSIEANQEIYFADGTIKTIVVSKNEDSVELKLLNSGKLTSRKGVNFPHTAIKLDAITPKDRADLEFGAKEKMDIVALSFVQSANDVIMAREILKSFGANPLLIAKIEMSNAIENLEEIIKVSDGVMVARGDLGAELGFHKVPNLQKQIIKLANFHAKPVITATQMLSSMIDSPYPTRAEVSDIANAVYDGTDAVMLSDETTIGRYPLEAVKILNDTILEAELNYSYHKDFISDATDAIAMSASLLSSFMQKDAIIVFTETGFSAKSVSKYRPKNRIIAVTPSVEIQRQLKLSWGVEPMFVMEQFESITRMLNEFIIKAKDKGLITQTSKFIVTMGNVAGKAGSTNLIRVLDNCAIRKMEERFSKLR